MPERSEVPTEAFSGASSHRWYCICGIRNRPEFTLPWMGLGSAAEFFAEHTFLWLFWLRVVVKLASEEVPAHSSSIRYVSLGPHLGSTTIFSDHSNARFVTASPTSLQSCTSTIFLL